MAPPGVHPQSLTVFIKAADETGKRIDRDEGWRVPLEKISEDLGEICLLTISDVEVNTDPDTVTNGKLAAVTCADIVQVGSKAYRFKKNLEGHFQVPLFAFENNYNNAQGRSSTILPMRVRRPVTDSLVIHFRGLDVQPVPHGRMAIIFKLTFSRIEDPHYSEYPQCAGC